MSRNITVAHRKLLWMRSAGRCAYPDCRRELAVDATDLDAAKVIGEEAHIFAHSIHGPRPNPDSISKTTNHYENLIMLCPTHHTIIDKQENTYPVDVLLGWKTDLERWVSSRLAIERFDSAELELIVSRLAGNDPIPPSIDFQLLDLEDKIRLNALSIEIQNLITMGMPRVVEVKGHINDLSKFDSTYPERLLSPLLTRYNNLRSVGQNGNIVFDDLRQFAGGNSTEFSIQAAALAVIVYFFHTCELFEK